MREEEGRRVEEPSVMCQKMFLPITLQSLEIPANWRVRVSGWPSITKRPML